MLWTALYFRCLAKAHNFFKMTGPVDNHGFPAKLSPGLFMAKFSRAVALLLSWVVIIAYFLAFQRLLKNVKLLVEFNELLTFTPNLAHCMQHCGVISSAK
jgi:hypothetical protein